MFLQDAVLKRTVITCKRDKKEPPSQQCSGSGVQDPAVFWSKDPGSGLIFFRILDPDPGSYCIKSKVNEILQLNFEATINYKHVLAQNKALGAALKIYHLIF
jgi:hypothetical protein